VILDAAKAAVLLFCVAIVQITVLSGIELLGGTPDLLLVTVAAIALLRGSLFGAAGGFFAGLLVDTASLGTLGLTSLVLTIVGYWIGRYGETTGRDRPHATVVSVAAATVMFLVGSFAVHFMLGEDVSARVAVIASLPATLAFNLLLSRPVALVCRRLLEPPVPSDRVREVRLLG
jgi:rod shape-determining protein MreD